MGKGTTELVNLLVLLGMGAVVPIGLALVGGPRRPPGPPPPPPRRGAGRRPPPGPPPTPAEPGPPVGYG
ncbi:hypothetical protein ACFQ6N_37940, partial [Kitasatospora sp. NPDC056446]